MIDTPAGQEADAKYIVTVANCHWIYKRNITVVALLAYATQRAQVAGNNLKLAIKEAPIDLETWFYVFMDQKTYGRDHQGIVGTSQHNDQTQEKGKSMKNVRERWDGFFIQQSKP